MTIHRILDKTCRAHLFVAIACAAACGPLHPCFANCSDPLPATSMPDPRATPTVVSLLPVAAWTKTAVTVHKGERFLVTATGNVSWTNRHITVSADGENGMPGWKVGSGGLYGRVGQSGKPFAIGARVSLFPDTHARSPHHPHPPPPIRMPQDGTLYLGFKDFVPGANSGMFQITIVPAVPIDP